MCGLTERMYLQSINTVSDSLYALHTTNDHLSSPPSLESRIWAGVEGELTPVEAGPRLQTLEAGGDTVVFVLLLGTQSH